MIAMVKIRLLETDEKFSLRGIIVEKQLLEDRSNGLIPFFVIFKFIAKEKLILNRDISDLLFLKYLLYKNV